MNKHMLLRLLLLILAGAALGGVLLVAWRRPALEGSAPASYEDCTFFTGWGLLLFGLLLLPGGGATSVNLTSTPGTGGGPLQFFSSDKRLAKDVARANTRRAELPGTVQACVVMASAAVTCFAPYALSLLF